MDKLKPRRWDENGRPIYWATDEGWAKYQFNIKWYEAYFKKYLEPLMLYGEGFNKKG
jgi:hypothetical protein